MNSLELSDTTRGALFHNVKDGRVVIVCEIEHMTGMPMIARSLAVLEDLDDWEVLARGEDGPIGGPDSDLFVQDVWLAKGLPEVDATEKAKRAGVLNDPMHD